MFIYIWWLSTYYGLIIIMFNIHPAGLDTCSPTSTTFGLCGVQLSGCSDVSYNQSTPSSMCRAFLLICCRYEWDIMIYILIMVWFLVTHYQIKILPVHYQPKILSPKNINDLLFGTQYHNKETLRDAHIEFGVIPYHQCWGLDNACRASVCHMALYIWGILEALVSRLSGLDQREPSEMFPSLLEEEILAHGECPAWYSQLPHSHFQSLQRTLYIGMAFSLWANNHIF